MNYLPTLTACAVLCLPAPAPAQGVPGLRLPPGFLVTEWADAGTANDIYCITFTPDGRLVVAGRGYLRLIEGADGDKPGAVREFKHPPADGAMGLLWDQGHLYAVGGGGLRRFRDVDQGGIDRPSELLFACKTGSEHDAHAIVKHPDGWFYLLCGNNAGITGKHATLPTSPIKEPTAGVLLRFPPDFQGCEIVADGFRNAYGLDFNTDGELFTYDSDNERCVGLPWYEFTRAYHIQPGGHHGWQSPHRADTWRMPPYFLDVVPPLAHLERGSPTGVVAYRHVQFPREYRDGVFLLDWTFGRIWFLRLIPHGGSYRVEVSRFLETTGELGFAPTSAAIHPKTGDLFVSIGGRGTRGGLYRIRYPQGLPKLATERVFSRITLPRSLEWQPDKVTSRLQQGTGEDLLERRRALDYLTRHAERIPVEYLVELARENLRCDDRAIRQATARLIAKLPAEAQAGVAAGVTEAGSRLTLALAGLEKESLFDVAVNPRLHPSLTLGALRITQRRLGDLPGKEARGSAFEGYTLAAKGSPLSLPQRETLTRLLPTNQPEWDREASRILALIQDDRPEAVEAVLQCARSSLTSRDDVHYLLVLARLRAARTPDQTARTASILIHLDALQEKEKQATDSNWPRRLSELYRELLARDPALNSVLLERPDFGRPAHALFTRAPGFDRVAAARKFLERRKVPGFAWNADLIGLLALLPGKETLPVVRELWGEAGLDDALLPLLAREPQKEDRGRFTEALALAQPALVEKAAEALARLGPSDSAEETPALLRALRDLPPGKEQDAVRDRLLALLRTNTGQPFRTLPEWTAWFRKADPVRAKQLEQGRVDLAAWTTRLGKIEWTTGDAERGKTVYTRASCAACHSGSQALGPDLRGVTGRFSREDLFTALIDPSKEVPTRYRMTAYTLEGGKVVQGIPIYEATDSLILQTGPATTFRVDSPQIRERRSVPQSLMPSGLLDRLNDAELADLYAYLRALK